MTFYLNATERAKVETIVSYNKAQGETIGIDSKWFQHLKDDKSKKEVAAMIRNNNVFMDLIKGILIREYEEILQTKKADYKSPSWALEKADDEGYMRALKNFMNLLTIAKQQ